MNKTSLAKIGLISLTSLIGIGLLCVRGLEVSANQSNYTNNLKCIGVTPSTKGNVIKTYIDEENKKIIYTIESQNGDTKEITVTDLK